MDNDSSHLDKALALLDKAMGVRATPPKAGLAAILRGYIETGELTNLRRRIESAYWRIDEASVEDRQHASRLRAAAQDLLREFAARQNPDGATIDDAATRLAQDLEALSPPPDGSPSADKPVPEAERGPGLRGVVGPWPLAEPPGNTAGVVGRWEERPPDEQPQPAPGGPGNHVPRTR
jgi:hypothetical protein